MASTLLAGVCVARSADTLALSQAVLNAMVNTMSRAHRIFGLLVKLPEKFFVSHWSHLTVTKALSLTERTPPVRLPVCILDITQLSASSHLLIVHLSLSLFLPLPGAL
jgi:hypothetical protein